jgi:phage terminase large subunit-like protein
LVDVLITSTGSRRQPLVWYITTADFARESICNEKYDYACKVRDGLIQDASFLPAIWEATIEDDWKSPEIWKKANPNLGVSVSLEYLERECQRAQEVPAYENTFKRLHLNIQTEQDVRAIPMDQWDRCGADYSLADLEGQSCFAGLDLSSKVDVTALVLCFPGEKWRLWPIFWVPAETAKMRERQNKTRFDEWIRRGWMQTTPGNSIDHAFIRKTINDLSHKVRIAKIAFDPWNAAQLSTELGEQDGFEVCEFRQGYQTMSEPTKMMLARLADGNLEHPNNPCLNWMAANFSTDEDAAGNLKPSKKKSTEKIDGIVASVMAMGLAALEPADQPQLILL